MFRAHGNRNSGEARSQCAVQVRLDVVRVHHISASLAQEPGQAQDSPGHPDSGRQTIDRYSCRDEPRRQRAGVLETHDARRDAGAVGVCHQVEDHTFESADIE
jgi:hypothetical protein